jgi:fibro-slime domain-containing protein
MSGVSLRARSSCGVAHLLCVMLAALPGCSAAAEPAGESSRAHPAQAGSAESSGAVAATTGGDVAPSNGNGGSLSLGAPPATDGAGAAAVDDASCGKLPIIIRDFPPYPASQDFENAAYPPANPADAFTVVQGIVLPTLGDDGKPVYANDGTPGGRRSLTDGASFAEWYQDVQGKNLRFDLELTLHQQSDGTLLYDSLVDGQGGGFFPIDGRGFGDYASTGHNFHFTTLARLEFRYEGGELFTFSGDDDLWMFIAGALAIDIGGIHARVERTVVLDDFAAAHGLAKGNTYPMDIFHAERHIGESNFKVRTSIACIRGRDVPK